MKALQNLDLEDYLSALNTVANLKDYHEVIDFLADEDNFHTASPQIEGVYNEYRYNVESQYGLISIGYNGDNRQEAINCGIEKIADALEYLIKNKIIYKIFAKPYVVDLIGMDTSTGLNVDKDYKVVYLESDPQSTLKDWKANPKFVVKRVLLLFWFFPTIEYIKVSEVGEVLSILDYCTTKDRLNSEIYKTLYPFELVGEGELAKNTMIVFPDVKQ